MAEPEDLHSENGVLKAELTIRNAPDPDGSVRYCYIDGAGNESPNLRVRPGDLVILELKNELTNLSLRTASHAHEPSGRREGKPPDPCPAA